MAIKGDTFTDAGTDVALTAHTPTGPNAGTSWDENVAGGSIIIVTGTDKITEDSNSSGNRRRLTDDLGSDEMDVQAEFTSSNAFGDPRFFAVSGRVPNSGSGAGIEAGYDHTLGTTGRYFITDGTTTTESANESWPGGTQTFVFKVRTNSLELLVGGVQKVYVTGTTVNSGNTRAGVQLGNFAGSVRTMTVDNFVASSGGGQPVIPGRRIYVMP